MTEQEIKAEHDRLRPIVFQFKTRKAQWAAMDNDGMWFVFHKLPELFEHKTTGIWNHTEVSTPDYIPYQKCKNQPETFLDWTDTLIKRGDE